MNWIELKEKALDEFVESGALATNQCPNYLRDAYFKAGFKAAAKIAQEELEKHKANEE